MGKKAETIVEILKREKERIEEEERKKEIADKERKNAEASRKERIDKKEKLQEKWAMYRWTIEYITENTDRWEKERKVREKERNDIMQEWDKKTRLEKVKTLKEKWLKKKLKDEKEKENKPQNWSIWREKKIEKEKPRDYNSPAHHVRSC